MPIMGTSVIFIGSYDLFVLIQGLSVVLSYMYMLGCSIILVYLTKLHNVFVNFVPYSHNSQLALIILFCSDINSIEHLTE